jgi:predicted NBD/HSP70 family sugar kinase
VQDAKPSLELVRAVTDERVLRALMRRRRLTRAELATSVGISKPTAGESVRRLEARGLVADTGERTQGGRGRGRVGTYYALAPAAGSALAVTIAPEGIVAERLDAYGDTVARDTRPIGRPAHPDRVAAALADAVSTVAAGPARVAVVGAADPVDRATGRLVQLPDAPFLVGELDAVAVVAPFVDGPVIVDNDVNWAALAERDPERLSDFAYLYLGEGLGCAIVDDGAIRRGRTGLTGEIAHLLTAGPHGRAVHLIDVFGELGLRRDGSTAIDVERLLDRCATEPGVRAALGTAVAGVVAAVVALADPQEIVVGGTWGPALVEDIRAAAARSPRRVDLRAAAGTAEPVLDGVRAEALARLREAITAPGGGAG